MALFNNALNERTLRIEIELGACWVMGDPVHGYVFTRTENNITDVTRLAVLPEFQKRGVGTQLLLTALQTPGPHMLTVRKDNSTALKLYKKYGFVIVADLPDIPAWIMMRSHRT